MKPNTGTMGIGVFNIEGMEYCLIESLNYAVNADQAQGGLYGNRVPPNPIVYHHFPSYMAI